jgi:hypothetical protein
MDWWYYKFSSIVDGSYPWINTGGLYSFITSNYYGRGPYGSPTTFCGLSSGDIVFMKNTSGDWQHAVIVSAIVGDCSNPANIIVASHSPYVLVPLNYSAFSPYTLHPVTISGYRK